MASNENLNIQNKTFTDAQMKQISWTLDTQFWWDTQKFQQSVVKQYGQDAWNTLQWNIVSTANQIKSATPVTPVNTNPANNIQTPEQAKANGVNVLNPEQLKDKNMGNQNGAQTVAPTLTPSISPVGGTSSPKIESPKVEPQTANPIQPTTKNIEDFNKKYLEYKNAWYDDMVIRNAVASQYGLESEQMKLVDQYQQSQLQSNVERNPDNIYNTLKSGGFIYNNEVLNSSEYKQAKARLDTYNQYKNYNQNQFSQALSKGLLLPWTTLYNDLIQDEKIKQEIDKANILNKINEINPSEEDIFINQWNEIANNTKVTINWQTNTLAQIFSDWMITQEEYNQMTNTPEITSKYQEVETLKNEVNTLENTYKNIRTETEKELKWSWATKSQMEALIWQRQRDIIWPLELAMSRYNNALWTLTQMKSDASQLFATNLSLYQQQQQRQQQLDDRANERAYQYFMTQENRAYQETLTQEQRAYNEALATQQLEQKFDYTYGNLNSTDERIRNLAIKNAVSDLYKQYPLPWMESQAQKEAKVMNLINQWMSPGQALAQIENEIRWSQRYKDYIASKSNENQYKFTEFGWNLYRHDGNWNIQLAIQWPTKYTKLDDGTYQDSNWNIVTKSELEQQKLLSNSYLNASVWTTVWIECGQFARNATWLTSTPGGNSLSERIKQFSETSPMPGWMVLFNGWNYDKTYWHIAVVTGINADWTINVKESNLNWDKKVTERTISLNDPNISWFYNNTPLTGGNGTDSSFNATDIRVFNSLTPSEKSKKQNDPKFMNFVEKQNEIFSNPDIDINELLKYSAGWWNLWETSIQQLSKFNQALSQVSELNKKLNNQTTWPIIWRLRSYNPYDSNAQALKAEINSLIPNIARWVYGEVWVLTDADIEQYRKTLPNLQSTEDTNKLVLAMTLKTMMNWYKWQLQTLASSGKDVSLFQWKYKDYENVVNGLLNWIWAWNTTTNSNIFNASNWKSYEIKVNK